MRITKVFIVTLTKEKYVKIDGDEIEKVVFGMEAGTPIIVRNGLINPSYIIGIMEDRERMREWIDDCNRSEPEGSKARAAGIIPLRNIFEGSIIGARMKLAEENVQSTRKIEDRSINLSTPL